MTPKGDVRWIEDRTGIERDEKGDITRYRGIILDISERKQAESELADERSRLASIIEGAQVGTWEWNVQTGETVFNETWAQIVGYTLEELAPVNIDTWVSLAHPEDIKGSDELLNKHFVGELTLYNYECRMRHKDGHWVWVHDQGRLMSRDADGAPLLMFGTHQDITERKRMEEMMIQSEKMLSVGGLAAGMAHEINNPLAGMLQTAQVLSQRLKADTNILANLKAAGAAGTTMKSIEQFMEDRGVQRIIGAITESGQQNTASAAQYPDQRCPGHADS
ncbi:PAS domain S-box protein [uncultured Desulfobacter sp.]|uniref:PAS domain-containing sensor histidine kinase n=1 Tax=uncultured Desulfobacter sp. TaxID=240139 RepID=UPI0029F4A5B5|nr:PAS domain S-box protein [uncultured Desulfobacter sp.]